MKIELNYQNRLNDGKLNVRLIFSSETNTEEAMSVVKRIKTGISEIVGGSMGGPVWDERDV